MARIGVEHLQGYLVGREHSLGFLPNDRIGDAPDEGLLLLSQSGHALDGAEASGPDPHHSSERLFFRFFQARLTFEFDQIRFQPGMILLDLNLVIDLILDEFLFPMKRGNDDRHCGKDAEDQREGDPVRIEQHPVVGLQAGRVLVVGNGGVTRRDENTNDPKPNERPSMRADCATPPENAQESSGFE